MGATGLGGFKKEDWCSYLPANTTNRDEKDLAAQEWRQEEAYVGIWNTQPEQRSGQKRFVFLDSFLCCVFLSTWILNVTLQVSSDIMTDLTPRAGRQLSFSSSDDQINLLLEVRFFQQVLFENNSQITKTCFINMSQHRFLSVLFYIL